MAAIIRKERYRAEKSEWLPVEFVAFIKMDTVNTEIFVVFNMCQSCARSRIAALINASSDILGYVDFSANSTGANLMNSACMVMIKLEIIKVMILIRKWNH